MFGFGESKAIKDYPVQPYCSMVDTTGPLLKLLRVLDDPQSGISLRKEQNRALMERLQKDAPEFLLEHPYVRETLQLQDDFLTQLARTSGLEEDDTASLSVYSPKKLLQEAKGA